MIRFFCSGNDLVFFLMEMIGQHQGLLIFLKVVLGRSKWDFIPEKVDIVSFPMLLFI